MTLRLLRLTIVSFVTGLVACDPEPQDSEMTPRGWPSVLEPCGAACNPLLQNCNIGEACMWGGDEWTCQTRTDDVAFAQACTEATECAPGLVCVEGSRVPGCTANHCCAQLCATDEVDVCFSQSECLDVFDGGQPDVGLCLTPVVPDMPAMVCLEELEGTPKPS